MRFVVDTLDCELSVLPYRFQPLVFAVVSNESCQLGTCTAATHRPKREHSVVKNLDRGMLEERDQKISGALVNVASLQVTNLITQRLNGPATQAL